MTDQIDEIPCADIEVTDRYRQAPATLAACEAVIERGLATFVEVGQALLRIRDERLYRATHHTFEAHCRERWNLTRRYANRQIQAAEVVNNLGTMVPIPENERQARALVCLPPETQREVWGKAIEESDGKITTKQLETLIREQDKIRSIHLQEEAPEGEVTVVAAERQFQGKPRTLRTQQRMNFAKRRMVDGLSRIRGLCRGLSELDVVLAAGVLTTEEQRTWVSISNVTSGELRDFGRKLKAAKPGNDAADGADDET